MADPSLCDHIHKGVDEKLANHTTRLDTQEDRMDRLENSQVRTEVIVQSLCEQIKTLVETMKAQQKAQIALVLGIAGTVILVLSGFLIWYIQSIPR